MDKHLIDIIGNIFLIIFGACSALFCKTIAKIAVEQQYKILHIRFNEAHYWPFFLIIGIGFVIFGILSLLKII